MVVAIPPPALSGSGSRVECFGGTPLSLAQPGSPCIANLYPEYNETWKACQATAQAACLRNGPDLAG